MMRYSLVSQLVRDGVRQHDAVVLVDGAAAVRLAHAGHVRHAQRAATSDTSMIHVTITPHVYSNVPQGYIIH